MKIKAQIFASQVEAHFQNMKKKGSDIFF